MRRRLTAIIGVAFCAGALTALWAARPWDPAAQRAASVARADDPLSSGSIGAVGTYGEAGGRAGSAPLDGEAVPPPFPSSDTSATAPPGGMSSPPAAASYDESATPPDLRGRRLIIPVQGVKGTDLQPTFHAQRAAGEHEALDVLAPKGTPVLAVEDGEIVKIFYSIKGGKTIYQFDRPGRYCYYYAHLDKYASDLTEKQQVTQGQVIGYVGSTGNADADAPHLHFAIFRLGPDKHWWQGTPVDPYPVLAKR